VPCGEDKLKSIRSYAEFLTEMDASVAGLIHLLAGFAVMQTIQVRRITRERDRGSHCGVDDGISKVSDPGERLGKLGDCT
jgi:hypothetical protein